MGYALFNNMKKFVFLLTIFFGFWFFLANTALAVLPVPEGAPLPENFEELQRTQKAEKTATEKSLSNQIIVDKEKQSQKISQGFFSFDHNLFKIINNQAGKNYFLDNLMIFFAKYLIFFLFGGIIFFAIWFFNIEIRQCLVSTLTTIRVAFFRITEGKRLIILAFVSSLFAFLINLIISIFRFRPRPFITHQEIHQLVFHISDKSFPSDHTTIAFVLAFSLFLINKKWGSIFLVLAFLIGFARIFCGLHYPLDVLGGILMAFIVVSLVNLILKFCLNKKKRV